MMLFARFGTVGVACALLHNAIMIVGDAIGLHYALSTLLSFAIVVPFGYWLHTRWTWPRAPRDRVSLARYALGMSGNVPLFMAGMFVFVDVASLPVAFAAPLLTILLFLFNFVATRWALHGR